MNFMMMRMLGLVLMNEAVADGGDAGGGAVPDVVAPADAPASEASTAPDAGATEAGSLLGDLAKPEGDNPASDDVGKPEADKPVIPEEYQFAMPEGVELDENTAPMLQDLFKDLGLPQDKAQAVLDKLLEIDAARQPTEEQVQQQYEQQATELNQKWGQECRQLPELGGDNFNKSLETCSQVMVKFASPELRNFLTYSALGSNPEFFKFVHAIGQAMSPDTLVHGGSQSIKRSPEEIMYGKGA